MHAPVALLALLPLLAHADEQVFTFGNEYSGSGGYCHNPEGCLTLHVAEIPGGVRMVLEGTMKDGETMLRLYGNVEPFMVAPAVEGLEDRMVNGLSFTPNGHRAGKVGDFDWLLTLEWDNPQERFDGNRGYLVLDFLGMTLPLMVSGVSVSAACTFAIYVRGLGADGDGEGWFCSMLTADNPDPPHDHSHDR